jgi:hypothetical protein
LRNVEWEIVNVSDKLGSVWKVGFCSGIFSGGLREETKTSAGIAYLREDYQIEVASAQSGIAIHAGAAFVYCGLLAHEMVIEFARNRELHITAQLSLTNFM